MMNHKGPNNEDGLTLIELLAVVVILGIIAAIAIPMITGLIQKAKTQAFVSNAYAMKDASTYYLKNQVLQEAEVGTKITYQELVEYDYIDEIKDPDTGKRWDRKENESYVTVLGENVIGVCLYGEKRNLCSTGEKGALINGPIPISDLSVKLVTEN